MNSSWPKVSFKFGGASSGGIAGLAGSARTCDSQQQHIGTYRIAPEMLVGVDLYCPTQGGSPQWQ